LPSATAGNASDVRVYSAISLLVARGATIRVPALVIQGGADRIVKVSAAKQIAATVPGALLLVYPGVGHAVQFDAPKRFDRASSDFMHRRHPEPEARRTPQRRG
jgi:pimeloyl-ACP methyl ester carboxylesterase